jgi:hypothetical protein
MKEAGWVHLVLDANFPEHRILDSWMNNRPSLSSCGLSGMGVEALARPEALHHSRGTDGRVRRPEPSTAENTSSTRFGEWAWRKPY